MDLKDLAGISKPITKLIEVISQGLGAIYKPYLIKKTADAKAYEIKVISDAIKHNQTDLKQVSYTEEKLSLISIDETELSKDLTLEERTEQRVNYQEQKKQKNVENITQKTAQQLENEESVSDEPVDEDWATRFFNYAEEISNEEMQNLWAQILAGEIKKPKSFSLRTLQTLRNLSKEEAQIFSKVANYVIKVGKDYFLYKGTNNLEEFGVNFSDLALLQELDLLHSGNFVNYSLNKVTTKSISNFIIGNKLVQIVKSPDSPKKDLPIILFTTIGKELINLIQPSPDFSYIQKLASDLKSENISVKYAHILKVNSDSIEHTNPLMEIPEL